jgi:hypothetical protein
VVAVAALGWLVLSRLPSKFDSSAPESASSQSKTPTPAPLAIAPVEAATPPVPAPRVAEKTTTADGAMSYPQMSLAEMLLPNNGFHDPLFGVSMSYPEGWSVRNATRWGQNNRENTVFFSPGGDSQAVPSMYYQNYTDGPPPFGSSEAFLREQARKKEEQRNPGGVNDYKNDADSFVFREIDGRPTLSYFATFTRGDQVQAEYFMRVLGQRGYVMFFVRGPAKDVQAIIPAVHKAGGTVKVP